ncbi:pilus assembly FimT family protein [Melittangium boletus]|uniref:pilus assembly FimT family protein n=1 Tax=Melittangium boletus TaxID=83453 RepID=UPI0012FE7D4F|nr:prepilin-type N-terminal cleavage/methylation domain-containing protein [Melittangium boletus]
MKSQANPARRAGRGAGFSLLEMVVVLGIVSVLAGLAMAAYDAVGRRGALQSAAFDLQGVLSSARAKAVSRGHPVWIVFHPTAGRASMTTGQGAFLMVEDTTSRFVPSPQLLFDLPLQVRNTVTAVYFLEDYSKKVRFSALTPGVVGPYKAPFLNLRVETCGFCSGAPPRGAIVFRPDGSARFVDGAGQYESVPNQALALSSLDLQHQYLFAISGPSGYVASFSP